MTEQEVRAIVRETLRSVDIKELVRDTVEETLLSLGVEHKNPLEMQKDFQHLREWRESVESVKSKSVVTAVGIVIAGILGMLWVGFRDMFGS